MLTKKKTMFAALALITAAVFVCNSPVSAKKGGGGGGGGGGDETPAPYRAVRLALPDGDDGIILPGGLEISDVLDGKMHITAQAQPTGLPFADVHWVVNTDGTIHSSEYLPTGLDAWGVNRLGQIVGASIDVDGFRGFLRQNGTTTILNPILGDECQAYDIDENGKMIVGREFIRDPDTGEIVSHAGIYWLLDADGNVVASHNLTQFIPREVRDAGDHHIIGGRTGTTSANEPAIVAVDADDNQVLLPLGFPAGSSWGTAYSLNLNLTVTGVYEIDGEDHGFVWTPGDGITMVAPLTEGGRTVTYGNNDGDLVVGKSSPVERKSKFYNYGWNGVVYADGVTANLHDLLDKVTVYVGDAHKINNQNFIIGRGATVSKSGAGTSAWSAILVIPIVP